MPRTGRPPLGKPLHPNRAFGRIELARWKRLKRAAKADGKTFTEWGLINLEETAIRQAAERKAKKEKQ